MSLVGKAPHKESMVDIPGTLFVRITRRVRDRRSLFDRHDNFSGGCKQLCDAIAAALGRKGDSEKDGLVWTYRQELGDTETVIEIFEVEGKQ